MSVSCNGLLLGKVSVEEIANVIKQKLGCDFKIEKSYHGNKNGLQQYDGYYTIYRTITFTYKGENRMLSVYFDSMQHDVKQHKDCVDLSNIYTQISVNSWGSSEEIIASIVSEFGGYIDVNDCDDKGYELVIQYKSSSIKPVIHITMNDIYEKFGGIVVID